MTVFGLDASHHQADLDFEAAYAEGHRFCWLKATEGYSWKDEAYPALRDRAWAAGLLVSAYHFLRDDSEAEAQADNLASMVPLSPLPIMIDCESSGDSHPDLSHIEGFLDACHDVGLNVRSLYLPRWYWDQIGSPGIFGLDLALVASNYGSNPTASPTDAYPGDESERWQPYGGVEPTFLQYGSQVLIAGIPMDGDAYRGPETDLSRWFGGGALVSA